MRLGINPPGRKPEGEFEGAKPPQEMQGGAGGRSPPGGGSGGAQPPQVDQHIYIYMSTNLERNTHIYVASSKLAALDIVLR